MGGFTDRVYGRVSLNELQALFIQHPSLVPLNEKRQLGLTYRVFSEAMHTRYNHSMGSMFRAYQVAAALKLNEHDTKLLQVAAVLHDVGHYPFSHTIEEQLAVGHEKVPQIVLVDEQSFGHINAEQLLSTIHSAGVDPKEVALVLAGKHRLSPLMSHEIVDIDKMDYLPRDQLSCGVLFGEDVNFLIEKLVFNGQYGVKLSGISSLFGLMHARNTGYERIYLHPLKQAGETMMQYCARLEPRLREGSITSSEMHRMSDSNVMDFFMQSEDQRVKDLSGLVRFGNPDVDWYKPVVTIGGKHGLARVRALENKKEELEAVCLEEGLLCTWFTGTTARILRRLEREPDFFAVYETDGSVTNFFDREHVRNEYNRLPERMFAIYGRTGSSKEREAAAAILGQYEKAA